MDQIFPYKKDKQRLDDYEYYKNLFMGDHFTAFRMRVNDDQYNEAYSKLRYVKINFAGLVSKVVADLLFSEPVSVKVPDGDQEFVDGMLRENKFDVLCYESALGASYYGDQVFKLRIKDGQLLMVNTPPTMYFPDINDELGVDPIKEEIAYVVEVEEEGKEVKYLRKEIHTKGLITHELYRLEGGMIKEKVGFEKIGLPKQPESEKTKINESLLIFTPNWKTPDRFWGISDYYDLDTIFYAINNRFTKIDNILDKHSDPILLVPDGIIDKDGKVKKNRLGVIEIRDGENNKPEYVVWDASLENAFKQIDHLIEAMFMISETSPDILGMGKGQAESGRALKLKLLRTLAKVQRKKLYYDYALRDWVYRSQLLAKAWGVKIDGKTMKGEAVLPEIEWQDGLPIDELEAIKNESLRLDAGLTTVKDSLIRLDNLDDQSAEEKATEIKQENSVKIPKSDFNIKNPFKGVNNEVSNPSRSE